MPTKIALLNEISAAQKVEHPNVVKVLYVDDGHSSPFGPFVFMEYVSGGTLTQRSSEYSFNRPTRYPWIEPSR